VQGGRPVTASVVERDVLIVACAISAGVHGALTPEHVREEATAGAGFLGSTVLLAVLCVALTYRPGSRVAVATAGAVLAGLLAAYTLAITTGVPLFHPEPEPADGLGLATKVIELVGLGVAIHLVTNRRSVGRLTRLQPKETFR
jgi:hypothetical protein